MSVKVTREAQMFYSMCAMLKVAMNYYDYLRERPEPIVQRRIKNEMNIIFGGVKRFFGVITADLPAADKQLWELDWKRDYMSAGSIFEHWSEMNDEQRNIMETFAEELLKGNIKVSHE